MKRQIPGNFMPFMPQDPSLIKGNEVNGLNIHSIKLRLIIYFLALIILPVFITLIVTHIKSIEIIQRKVQEAIDNNIGQLETNVDGILENSKGTLNVFITNDDFKSLLTRHIKIDSYRDFQKIREIMNLLSNLVASSRDIDSIYVYDRFDDLLITSNHSAIANSDFASSPIFREAVKKRRTEQWIPNRRTQPPFTVNDNLVTYAMPIKIYERDLVIGYVFINVNERALYKYLEQIRFDNQGYVVIANPQGEVISYRDPQMLGRNNSPQFQYIRQALRGSVKFPLKINGGTELVFQKTSPKTGFYYFAVAPLRKINQEINTLRNVIILVALLTILLACLLSFVFLQQIYIPIDRLVAAMMKVVNQPNFDYRIREQRRDEFGILYSSFNQMVNGMKQLLDQLVAEKLKKKEVQLRLLQAQINPHFLYNTLNSIYCIAKLHQVPEITQLSHALINFFRISLSGGQELIRVREMLAQIDYYVSIQNVRYQGRFDVVTDIEEELLDWRVLKFLLQPLVENAIMHGMKNQEERGVIEITGYRTGDGTKFTVRDNGVGIPARKLEEIWAHLAAAPEEEENGDMFALRNINRRIRLYYGESYGLHIFSTEGSGTVVEVFLPADLNGDKNV